MNNGKLIRLPGNPLLEVGKTFSTDEFLSFLFDFFATLWLTHYIAAGGGEHILAAVNAIFNVIFGGWIIVTIPLLFALVGPVCEKIGFFPKHIWDSCWERFKDKKEGKAKTRGFYAKKAMSRGFKSMGEDIVVHDPIYVTAMFFGVSMFPWIPPWVICIFCFLLAVFIVMILEVGIKEVLHKTAKVLLVKKGFEEEPYYEARFLFDDEEKAREVFGELAKKFVHKGEDEIWKIHYHDRYFSKKEWYNGRVAKLRSRDRHLPNGEPMRTWQIVYTLAKEEWGGKTDQFRYFISLKEKMYYLAEHPEHLHQPDNIPDRRVRETVKKMAENEVPFVIEFERFVADDPECLLITLDVVKTEDSYLIEIKARPKNKAMMQEAMQYAMHFGGLTATDGKYSLFAETV
ncbi:MAG: hypothetical protein WCT49_00880 [Candidatus Paceibacterota bacterium]|jgi:protein-S-isoprenylcysteine O-methyltransferase Ste14|nr:hypothetical protein [Candidatus Paceibacterota bacterium]